MKQIKKLLNHPVILANNATNGAREVTYKGTKKIYTVNSKCEGVKCVTRITFKAAWTFNTVDSEFADRTGWETIADLVAPRKPLIDGSRVLNYMTSEIAKY